MKQPLAIWLAAAAVVAVAAFLGGRVLHQDAGESSAFDLDVPAYESAETIAGFSRGGFSGFGEVEGFEGRTVLGGRIVAVDGDSMTVETAAGLLSRVRLTNETLLVMRPGGRDELRPGVTIAVRQQPGSDEAEAVLVYSGAPVR